MKGKNNTQTNKRSGEDATGNHSRPFKAVPDSGDGTGLYGPKTPTRVGTGVCPSKHHLPH